MYLNFNFNLIETYISFKCAHYFLPANRSKYSMVNHEMQTASIRASFGLSIDSSIPSCCTRIDGIVLSVMPIVETTTKDIDITEMI